MMSFNDSTENLLETNGEPETGFVGHEYLANSSLATTDDYFYDWETFFSQFQFKLDKFLWEYMSIVVTIVSFLGNLIIMVVLSQKKSRHFSTSIFMINLAVSDICVCFSTLEGWLLFHRFVAKTYSELDCKLRMFIPKVTNYVSVWMLVLIAIERALSVKIPLKVKTIFTVKVARILVGLVWVLSVAKVILNTSLIEVLEDVDGLDCFIRLSVVGYLYIVDLILFSMLTVILPYPIIFVCTVLTIIVLLQNVIGKSTSKRSKVKSVTVTLVIVNVMYLISVAPAVVNDIYTLFWLRLNKIVQWNLQDYFYYASRLNIFAFASFLHHSYNFFIYFLSGTRFREETKDLLLSLISRKKVK